MVINPPKRWSNWSESMCWFRIWTLVAKLVKITHISLGLIRGIYPVEGWLFGIKHHEPAELKPRFNLQSWLRYNSINLIVGIPIVFSSISGCPLLHPHTHAGSSVVWHTPHFFWPTESTGRKGCLPLSALLAGTDRCTVTCCGNTDDWTKRKHVESSSKRMTILEIKTDFTSAHSHSMLPLRVVIFRFSDTPHLHRC